MGVLGHVIINFQPTVRMFFRQVVAFVFHEIQQDLFSHFPQVPGYDFVVPPFVHAKVLEILLNGIPGGRRHGCPHIHGILSPQVNHPSGGNPRNLHLAFFPFCRQHHRPTAGNGPGSAFRPLVAVA